ncbi:F-box/WD repeat-containing protein 7 [Xenopus tropicalis]|uniref:F-box/WD repeat-containing protein 7 n=1 Tax=Xenopus tropicalis TaxID=8364 RepID=A0A803JLI5_XENTR|nr:F-box/WD repeat-containing protein 7 [Xenopus tropicalis]
MEAGEPQDCTSWLPDELALRILSYLDAKDILQVAQTCQRWRELAEDEGLWQGKCKADGIEEPPQVTRSRAKGSGSGPWKSAYTNQLRIDTNWHRGRFKTITLDTSESGTDFFTWTSDGKEMICIVDKNTIQIWSAVTGEPIRTLVGHTDKIFAIQMRDHMIVSGSWDCTIKVWNAESGECIHTLGGHTDAVSHLYLHGNRVASGSCDDSIRIWDIETGQCLHVLMAQIDYDSYVNYDGRWVISRNDGSNLKIWDPETQSCLRSFPIPITAIHHTELKGSRLLLVTDDGTITVWDTDTGQRIQTIKDLQTYISAVSLRANIFIWGDKGLPAGFDRKRFQRYVENVRLRSHFDLSNTGFGPVPLWGFRLGTGWDENADIYLQGLKRRNKYIHFIIFCRTKLICMIEERSSEMIKVLDFNWEERRRKRLKL